MRTRIMGVVTLHVLFLLFFASSATAIELSLNQETTLNTGEPFSFAWGGEQRIVTLDSVESLSTGQACHITMDNAAGTNRVSYRLLQGIPFVFSGDHSVGFLVKNAGDNKCTILVYDSSVGCSDSDQTFITSGEGGSVSWPPGADRSVRGVLIVQGNSYPDMCSHRVTYSDGVNNGLIRFDPDYKGEYVLELGCLDKKFPFTIEESPCTNGCFEGACLSTPLVQPSSPGQCVDSDGGKNLFVKGVANNQFNGLGSSYSDTCLLLKTVSPNMKQYLPVQSCDGPDCTLQEAFCSSVSDVGNFAFSCKGGCKDGACVGAPGSTSEVAEIVTCNFKGSQKMESCVLASGIDEQCKGVGSCVVNVDGYNGEKMTWKSSCGGYAYTSLDGVAEEATFNCLPSNEVDPALLNGHGFRSASWGCYDGKTFSSKSREEPASTVASAVSTTGFSSKSIRDTPNIESSSGSEEDAPSISTPASTTTQVSTNDNSDNAGSCQSSEHWQKLAKESCDGHCSSDNSKCGVNSFAVSEECYTKAPQESYAPTVSVSEASEIGTLVCKDSCPLDNKCYPFGYRKKSMFCSDEGIFSEQFKAETLCDNSFECSSNVCISGKCVSQGALDSFFSWFKKLFGTAESS